MSNCGASYEADNNYNPRHDAQLLVLSHTQKHSHFTNTLPEIGPQQQNKPELRLNSGISRESYFSSHFIRFKEKKLQKAVLAEMPFQITSFMKSKNIHPGKSDALLPATELVPKAHSRFNKGRRGSYERDRNHNRDSHWRERDRSPDRRSAYRR